MKKYKIKIKVRHIVIALIILLLIFPGVVYVIGDSLVNYGENKDNGASFKYYGAAMMEGYTKLPKLIPESGETYYKIGTSYYNVIKDKQSIGTNAMTNIPTGNKERVNKSIENFKKGLEFGESDKAYTKNLSMVINSYIALGESGKAYEYIEQAIVSSNTEVREMGFINKAILKAKDREVEEALAICKSNMSNEEFGNLYLEILYNYGEMEKYNTEIYKVKYNTEIKDIKMLNQTDFTYRLRYSKSSPGDKVLKGRIVKDGEGVPYQKVSLQTGQYYFGSYRSIQSEEGKAVYTDKDGYYEFKEIVSGEYPCTAILQGYLLDNSYIFQNDMWKNTRRNTWPLGVFKANTDEKVVEKNFTIKNYLDIPNKDEVLSGSKDYLTIMLPRVEGAAEVEIDLTFIGKGYSLFSKIDENFEVKIPLSNGKFIIKHLDNTDANNSELIGNLKDIETHIGITYRDEKGEILEKTKPFDELKFIAKGKILNEGDKLISQEKYDEAIKWYNERMKVEGDKREYLYPILRYYQDWNYVGLDEKESKKNFEKYLNRLEALGIEDVEVNYFEWRGSDFHDQFAGD